MGSLNAWAQVGRARFWQSWLAESPCSADTLGRVHALLYADGLRQGIHQVYERLKRNNVNAGEKLSHYCRCWAGPVIHQSPLARTQYEL